MDNNINEVKSLIKKNRSILEIIKSKIKNIFGINNDEEKYDEEIVNPEIYYFNFPQYNIPKEEMDKLIKASEEEMKERKKLEEEYNMPYYEIVKKVENEYRKDEKTNNDEIIFEDYNTNEEELVSRISDKESYDELVNKLKLGEITEEELSISDLLKINAMLREEIDIKLKKINKNSNENLYEEIERLEKENKEIEEIINKNQ